MFLGEFSMSIVSEGKSDAPLSGNICPVLFGLRERSSKGKRIGNIAYGYRLAEDGIHVEADPVEQAVLAEIRRRRLEGLSLRKVAAALNARGYTTRRGTNWRLESVARIVNQEARRTPVGSIGDAA